MVLNLGSAVMLPEVFLKALSVARNLGADLADLTTVNFDQIQHYRPRVNVVERPTRAPGAKGYALTGHHEIMVPLFAGAVLAEIGRDGSGEGHDGSARPGDHPGVQRGRQSAEHPRRSARQGSRTTTCWWWTTARATRPAGSPVSAACRVLRHAVNLGLGGALQTGFRYAIEHGYESASSWTPTASTIRAFLERSASPVLDGECDVAIGSRFVAASGYHAPLARRLGMLLFSGVVRFALGQRIADTTSGFRAYRREVMEVCQHDVPKDFPDAPLLIVLARRGFRLLEVPVTMRERTRGRSFYTLGKSLYYPYKNLLASLMAWIRRPV